MRRLSCFPRRHRVGQLAKSLSRAVEIEQLRKNSGRTGEKKQEAAASLQQEKIKKSVLERCIVYDESSRGRGGAECSSNAEEEKHA